MIRVKESLFYLTEFICNCIKVNSLDVSAETIRKAKLDDHSASDAMLKFIVGLIGQIHKFKIKDGSNSQDYKTVLSLYLSLNDNPFSISSGIAGEGYDLDSSRSLLKILCWLLFSNQDFLRRLDQAFLSNLSKPSIISKSKNPADDFELNIENEASKISNREYLKTDDILQLKTLMLIKSD